MANSRTTQTPIDHSKVVVIKINGMICFCMLGSSNFSYSTYCYKYRKIREADIAFIKACNITSNLIKQYLLGNDDLQALLINNLLDYTVSYDENLNFNKWFSNNFYKLR